jgi:hypothetical protein
VAGRSESQNPLENRNDRGSSSLELVAAKVWITAPRFCGLRILLSRPVAAARPVVGSRIRLIPTVAGRVGTIESTDPHSATARQAIAVFSIADHSSRPHEVFQTTKSWHGYSSATSIKIPKYQ